jgi:predicted permease
MLLASPVASMAAILTLGLGIGLTTAIFSGVRAVLLRPLPYSQPTRLIAIEAFLPKLRIRLVPSHYFAAWQQSESLEHVAAYDGGSVLILSGMGEATRVDAASVTRDFFRVLGVDPALGRAFTNEEDRRGGPRAVVLSHSCWVRRFGGDRAVLGRTVRLSDRPHTIVGVLPPSFRFPGMMAPEFFVPFALPSTSEGPTYLVQVIGRLRPGIDHARATAELAVLGDVAAKQLSPIIAPMLAGARVSVLPLQRQIAGDSRPLLLVLLASAMCVLLIACVNVANLQLARTVARRPEFATRAALGAPRGRLIGQLITESLFSSAPGIAVALPLAYWGVVVIRNSQMFRLPSSGAVAIDAWVFTFAVGLTLLAGLLCGSIAALGGTRLDVNDTLKAGTPTITQSGRLGARRWLLVSEVSLACVLLVASGLLARTLWRLTSIDPGFRPERVLTMDVSLPESRYPAGPQQIAYFDTLLRHARSAGGAQSAAVTDMLPLHGFAVTVKAAPEQETETDVPMLAVSSKYFETLGIPLLAGRDFSPRDATTAPGVAIVSEEFTRQLFHESGPIGKRFRIEDEDGARKWLMVVGVVANVRQAGLDQSPEPLFYRPYTQLPRPRMVLVVRTSVDPHELVSTLRRTVTALDRDVALFDTVPMEEHLWASVSRPRSNARLFGMFALLALLLAMVGVYGVMAHAVSERTREVAIRVALGARRRAIVAMILRDGLRVAVAGVAIGLLGALVASRMLQHMLFGVRPTDVVTFAAVPAVLLTVVLLATFIPARHAVTVDVAEALRRE